MKNRKRILIFLLGLLLVAIITGLYFKRGNTGSESNSTQNELTQVVSTDDPVDIVLDFYGDWLSALESTSTDPQQAGLTSEPLLSQALRDKLNNPSTDQLKDPVLCQDPLPVKIRTKQLFEKPDEMQFVIFSKENPLAGQSIATTKTFNDGWYIDDIYCSQEFDEPREFTFEHGGSLLKQHIPLPYDSQHWHLVYTQENTPGHIVPLYFDTESVCIDTSGSKLTCDQNGFQETQKVKVHGNMTEAGVDVKRMEFLNN